MQQAKIMPLHSSLGDRTRLCLKKIKINSGRVQWLTPIIPALSEAEAGEEIETILVNMVKPRLYQKYKT